MNLHLDGFDLWQTPTFITYMCLSYNKDGTSDGGRDGVTHRYILWVKHKSNGVWEDEEDRIEMFESIKDHIEELKQFLKQNLKAEYWVM